MSVTLCGADLPSGICTEVTLRLTEQAWPPGLGWFHIHPSVLLQLRPNILEGGRRGLVNLPLPTSGISVPFLQVPST